MFLLGFTGFYWVFVKVSLGFTGFIFREDTKRKKGRKKNRYHIIRVFSFFKKMADARPDPKKKKKNKRRRRKRKNKQGERKEKNDKKIRARARVWGHQQKRERS